MKKLIGILIGLLVITTVLPITTAEHIFEKEGKGDTTTNNRSNDIWLVRGIFKYLDDDDDYIYLKAITSRLFGINNGITRYRISFCTIKLSKPFNGIFTNDFSIVAFGVCNNWNYVDI